MGQQDQGSVIAESRPSIHDLYVKCLSRVKNVALLLQNDADTDNGLIRLLEVYGRLRTWGEEFGATVPANARGSLLQQLSKDAGLERSVEGILLGIRKQLDLVLPSNSSQETDEQLLDGEPRTGAEIESISGSGPTQSKRMIAVELDSAKLSNASWFVNADIDSLYQIAMMVAQPSYKEKYLSSAENDEPNPRVAIYAGYDLQQITAKFDEWQRSKSKAFDVSQRSLISRLTRANLTRRTRLLHWSECPEIVPGLEELLHPTPMAKQNGLSASDEPPTIVPDVRPQSIADAVEHSSTGETHSHQARSQTHGDYSTVDESGPVGGYPNRIPDVPTAALQANTFECPFCHTTLESSNMSQKEEWKCHVLKDLRPYICTFGGCQDSDMQYQTRYDWIQHETKDHRREWPCKEHRLVFATRTDFIKHVKDQHLDSIPENQASIFADMCERPMSGHELAVCAICADKQQLSNLYDHLAEHLESVALISLSTNRKELETQNQLKQDIQVKREEDEEEKEDVRLSNAKTSFIEADNPLVKAKEDALLFDARPPEKAAVQLRFSLGDSYLSQDKIEAWARQLNEACHGAEVPLRRIDWVKMETPSPGQHLRDVVHTIRREMRENPIRKRWRRVIEFVIKNNRNLEEGEKERSQSRNSTLPLSPDDDGDEKRKETQRRTWFENAIKEKPNIPNNYLQVAPLIIRWDPEIDDYVGGHTSEINDLKRVFRRFGFAEASEVHLDRESAQHTLNLAITAHIKQNDGPNKLMIIYYTGHGVLDEHNQLVLAARRDLRETAAAYWHKAEKPLLDPDDMKADVLTILDCCYASDAHKSSRGDRRVYDLLAACPPGKFTPDPGINSFTRRLITTLNDLLDKNEDQRILTTRLMEEINQINTSLHNPVKLHDRLHNSINDGRHVQLARISVDSKSKTGKPHEKASVLLRFSFYKPMATQEMIETWAYKLNKACDGDDDHAVTLRHIDWVKMEETKPGNRLYDAVAETSPREHLRKIIRTVIRNNNALGRSKKRARSKGPPFTTAKRRALGDSLMPFEEPKAESMTPDSNAGQ